MLRYGRFKFRGMFWRKFRRWAYVFWLLLLMCAGLCGRHVWLVCGVAGSKNRTALSADNGADDSGGNCLACSKEINGANSSHVRACLLVWVGIRYLLSLLD